VEVAGLPTSLVDDDLEAKQFDLLVLRTQLALLRQERTLERLKSRIIEVAGLLEELQNVPIVAAELPLILEIQTPDYWQGIQAPMLETVRRRLRALVKLIEVEKRSRVYSDFEDEIGLATEVEVTGMPVGTDMNRFRSKARQFLKAHENHIAVLKLRRNDPLTKTDLDELERMFAQAGMGSPDEIDLVRQEGGLGVFVRSLIGLDRSAAIQALEGFIQGRTLTASQHEFLNVIVEHLTARGVVDPRTLYEPPFTDLNPLGVAGLFSDAEVHDLIRVLREIRGRAAA
jgi:type I restriction enzyme, R subunit